MIYLGGLLQYEGRGDSELSRRLGLATADFKTLEKVWLHSSLGAKRKIEIFKACVLSVLRYGLETMWLGKAARRRLDGFHARCLRKILKVPPAYYSRISNEGVLRRANCLRLSRQIFSDQLILFGTIAAGEHDALRAALFQQQGSLALLELSGPKCRGRPRHTWSGQLMKHAEEAACGLENLNRSLVVRPISGEWRHTVSSYIGALPFRTF